LLRPAICHPIQARADPEADDWKVRHSALRRGVCGGGKDYCMMIKHADRGVDRIVVDNGVTLAR
jgi:hypothetical protein